MTSQILSYRIITLIIGITLSTGIYCQNSTDSLKLAPFGELHVYTPAGATENLIIMISGDGGWRFGVVDFAKHFASFGNIVVGVNILQYNSDLRNRQEECYHIVNDYVTLASYVEKKYNFPQYREPILMGYSSGATMVYALLAQARPGTFKGGISLGFCPDVELPKIFCEFNGLKIQAGNNKKSFNLDPDSRLGNRWIVLHGKNDHVCDFQTTQQFISQTADAELIALDNVGHGFSKWSDFMPEWDRVYQSLLLQPEKKDQNGMKDPVSDTVNDLPIVVTNAKIFKEDAPLFLFISGDGGWYSFEQYLSDHLAEMGVPTIGLDAKKYFWNRRTPEESASDLERLLNHFSSNWDKQRIVLMGYSLGAEVLPFIYEKLSDDIKDRIDKVVLLSPGETGDFEVHLSNMLGIGSFENDYNVSAEIKKITPGASILIVTGETENSKLPAELEGTGVEFATVPGDHHYNNDSFAIIQVLKKKNLVK